MTLALGKGLTHREKLMIIAGVIRDARREAGLSQRCLARLLGKANSHVSMIESGRRRIDALELYLVARIIGVDPAALFSCVASRLDGEALPSGISERRLDRRAIKPPIHHRPDSATLELDPVSWPSNEGLVITR